MKRKALIVFMLIVVVVLAYVAIFLAPAAAGQAPVSFDPHIVGNVTDPAVLSALAVADDQWRDYGREPDCKLSLLYMFDNAGYSAGADVALCAMGYQVEYLARNEADRHNPNVFVRRAGYNDLCHVTVHEKGHLLGYADMDPVPGWGVMHYDTLWAAPLPRCDAWVDVMEPRPTVTSDSVPAPRAAADKGSGAVELTVTAPCRLAACKTRARSFARRRRAAICQKADAALTSGRPTPSMRVSSNRGGSNDRR